MENTKINEQELKNFFESAESCVSNSNSSLTERDAVLKSMEIIQIQLENLEGKIIPEKNADFNRMEALFSIVLQSMKYSYEMDLDYCGSFERACFEFKEKLCK